MYELPLFPLNTVLFPGMPLALHIFEDHYKVMIGLCLERRQSFGVVLIRQGDEALGPLAEPHLVGCTAQITQVKRLGQGRMNIGAIGRRRFRILSMSRDKPYLVGEVVNYPLSGKESSGTESGINTAANRLRHWVARYMDELSNIEGADFDPLQLPDEPVRLAYLAATLLHIPEHEKQMFLTSVSTVELLRDLRSIYRREVAFLKMMSERKVTDQGYFSLN
jgi:Lon protease-like protein